MHSTLDMCSCVCVCVCVRACVHECSRVYERSRLFEHERSLVCQSEHMRVIVWVCVRVRFRMCVLFIISHDSYTAHARTYNYKMRRDFLSQ